MTFHVEDVPRYETPNPYGYNEAALVEKTRVLKELAQLYPDVNPLWREWVYDVLRAILESMPTRVVVCCRPHRIFSQCITKDHARTKSGAQ